MHSMREDRLPEYPRCQCCFCIDAITSSTRCARTDCKNTLVASVSCGSTPSLQAFDARGPLATFPTRRASVLHRRHHFKHSMREDRLQEHSSCQCFLWIDAITSCIRCARTDCQNTRDASVAFASMPSLQALDARGPIARTL